MCMECRHQPCRPACPNADDPPGVFTCVDCGERIRVGEDYRESKGGLIYCLDCISTHTADYDDLDDGSDDAYDAYQNLLMEEAA